MKTLQLFHGFLALIGFLTNNIGLFLIAGFAAALLCYGEKKIDSLTIR